MTEQDAGGPGQGRMKSLGRKTGRGARAGGLMAARGAKLAGIAVAGLAALFTLLMALDVALLGNARGNRER